MIYCASCGTANREGSVFCNNCGQELPGDSQRPLSSCSSCGAENEPGAASCFRCGAALQLVSESSTDDSRESDSPAHDSDEDTLPSWLLEEPLPDWIAGDDSASSGDNRESEAVRSQAAADGETSTPFASAAEAAPAQALSDGSPSESLDASLMSVSPADEASQPSSIGPLNEPDQAGAEEAASQEKDEETTLITGLLSDEDLPEWLKSVDLPVEEDGWTFPEASLSDASTPDSPSTLEPKTAASSSPTWLMEDTSQERAGAEDFPWEGAGSTSLSDSGPSARAGGPLSPRPPSSEAANLLASLATTPPAANLLTTAPEGKDRIKDFVPVPEKGREARSGGKRLLVLLILVVIVALAALFLVLAYSNQFPTLSGLLGR